MKGIKNMLSIIQEINRKYSQPALTTSRGVKLSLLLLRLYLLFMVGLLVFKFFISIKR